MFGETFPRATRALETSGARMLVIVGEVYVMISERQQQDIATAAREVLHDLEEEVALQLDRLQTSNKAAKHPPRQFQELFV